MFMVFRKQPFEQLCPSLEYSIQKLLLLVQKHMIFRCAPKVKYNSYAPNKIVGILRTIKLMITQYRDEHFYDDFNFK